MRDRAARIVQLGRSEREVGAVRLNHAARGVVQRIAHVDAHCRRSELRDRPAMVRQGRRGQCELVGFELAAAVVEQTVGLHAQIRRDDRTAPVRHRADLNRRIRARADLAAVIRQRAAGNAEVRVVGQELAARVVQRAANRGRQPGLAVDRPRRVVQRASLNRYTSVAGNRALHVRHRTCAIAERQCPGACMRNRAAVVHQRSGGERQVGTVGLQHAAARIVERTRHVDDHRAGPVLRDRPCVVHHVGGRQRDLIGLYGTCAVVEGRAGQRRRLAGDGATAVDQARAGIDRHLLRGLQLPAAVVDRPTGNLEIRVRVDRRVVGDIPALHGHVAVAADHAALRAVRRRARRVRELTGCGQHQTVGIERRHAARGVVDRGPIDGRATRALDRALVVRDGAAAQRHRAVRHELAGLIGDLPCRRHRQWPMRRHHAALVRYVAARQGRTAAARQVAVIVDDRARGGCRDRALGARRRVREIHVAGRRGQRQVAVRSRRAAGEVHTVARRRYVAPRDVLAGRAQLARRRELQVSRLRDGTVTVHARGERAGRIQRAGVHPHVLLRGQGAAVREIGGGTHRRGLLAGRGAAVVDPARCRHREIAGRLGLAAQHQPAVRLQRQVAGLRRDRAGVRHPDAGRVADQEHPVCIHAAQLRDVDRDGRGGSVALNRRRRERAVIDLIRTGDHVEIFRVDGRVRLHGPGYEIHLIDVRRIQARPLHRNQPARYVVAGQRTVGAVIGLARRQGRATRIDEAAAVHDDARRVGDDDFRPLPGHFDVTSDLAHRRTVDLVDDDARRIVRPEVRVAVDIARLLRIDDRRRVVQDRAVFLNVELVVGIERHARARRPVDVHLRQSVRRLDH